MSCCEIPWDIPNWAALIGEILIAIALGAYFYWRQKKASEHVDELIEKKAKLEQKYKFSQCERIIDNLQEMLEGERTAMQFLTNYPVGELVDQFLLNITKITIKSQVISFPNKIIMMSIIMEKLEEKLNDTTLGKDFLEYVGSFNHLPNMIVERNVLDHEQKHLREGLIDFIKKQIPEIEKLIKRFTQEMASSSAEVKQDQSIAHDVLDPREVLDRSKYFVGPKL